jgi:hypothetical protein
MGSQWASTVLSHLILYWLPTPPVTRNVGFGSGRLLSPTNQMDDNLSKVRVVLRVGDGRSVGYADTEDFGRPH